MELYSSFFATFEDTPFPRFMFSSSLSFAHARAASEVDIYGKNLNVANMTSVANTYDFSKQTFVERLKLWSFSPEDHTTYWRYFRRPSFLLSFPNVIIVSWPNHQ